MDPLNKMVYWSKSRYFRKRPSLPQENAMRSYLKPPFPSEKFHGEFTLQKLLGITRNVCFQLLFFRVARLWVTKKSWENEKNRLQNLHVEVLELN